jgi:hypothetical protein
MKGQPMIRLTVPGFHIHGSDLRPHWSGLSEACRIIERRPDLIPMVQDMLDDLAKAAQ